MTDDVEDLLIMPPVIRHSAFLQFYFRSVGLEHLHQPNHTPCVRFAVRHTRTEGHLPFDIGIGGIGTKSRTNLVFRFLSRFTARNEQA